MNLVYWSFLKKNVYSFFSHNGSKSCWFFVATCQVVNSVNNRQMNYKVIFAIWHSCVCLASCRLNALLLVGDRKGIQPVKICSNVSMFSTWPDLEKLRKSASVIQKKSKSYGSSGSYLHKAEV